MNWQSHPGPPLDWLERAPDSADAPAVIYLHGFGANAADLAGLAPHLGDYRHLLPEGPLFSADMPHARAWYERGGNEDARTVACTMGLLYEWLALVEARYRPSKMALVGFSQGGAVALRLGLPRPERFAGIATLSGSLRQLDDLTPTLPASRSQRLFVAHGRADDVVACDVSAKLAAYLRLHRYTVRYQTYPVAHSISPRELDDLREWLAETLR